MNVAARLQQAAEPGEILLGAETQWMVRDAVEVEALAPLPGGPLGGGNRAVEQMLRGRRVTRC